MARLWLPLASVLLSFSVKALAYTYTPPPKFSPATHLPNQLYQWRSGQKIRYQAAGPENGEPVVLVHGLFVNSDHWRKSIKALSEAGYRAYAIDLWGCGYSSKPPCDSPEAQAVNGEEHGRFDHTDPILRNAELGTADGKSIRIVDVELRHPLHSPYNFYTWSEVITDFCQDIVQRDQVTLVANSIGTISALQAVLDTPDLYRGVFVISPNFRELHSAEVAVPQITMPILRTCQKILRTVGQVWFDILATPSTVKEILLVPYEVDSAVDDVLVQVLLDPLLTEGASKVVFDTLSYSAGPLPEPQLEAMPENKPVWVCYGKSDPWTPSARVEKLISKKAVERVVGWDNVGHCPHDEAPEKVHPLLFEFLNRVCRTEV